MGWLLAQAIGHPHVWSRQRINNWEKGHKPLTTIGREAYRRLLLEAVWAEGYYLRQLGQWTFEKVRPCRRCRRLFAPERRNVVNCRRCRR